MPSRLSSSCWIFRDRVRVKALRGLGFRLVGLGFRFVVFRVHI